MAVCINQYGAVWAAVVYWSMYQRVWISLMWLASGSHTNHNELKQPRPFPRRRELRIPTRAMYVGDSSSA